ncbi:glycosyl-4,4'-diaponeurosporenoate acyltransferase CrtO family protein [Bullifex porci]|uniref:glycosyl-4,4'-diaponeurosporenoate acyltransferase CrtO family protein n=1 Tax=Bullifex porci TaxID=2606638 RepID=UPI0038B26758
MLHSELVHIAIVILSYIPLIISIFWSYLNDSILIFLITSVLSSLMDMSFVVAQRYNSPRVKRLMSLIVKEH